MIWLTGAWLVLVVVAARFGLWSVRRAISRLAPERFGLRVGDRQDLERVTTIARTLLAGAVDAVCAGRLSTLGRRGEAVEPFFRPFYFEGVGMGYPLRAVWDFRSRRRGFLAYVDAVQSDFLRLYLAGLGMWYEARWHHQPTKVERLIGALPPDLRYFSADGYGFSRGLFRETSAALAGWLPFSYGVQRAYCHGLARGLWIRFGDAPQAILSCLDRLPPHLRREAYSGLGMGIAFTRIDDLPRVFDWGDLVPESGRRHYFLGVTLGLYIHALGQPAWARALIRQQAQYLTEAQQEWAMEALRAPRQCWSGLNLEDQNVHWHWREAVLTSFSAEFPSGSLGSQKGAVS